MPNPSDSLFFKRVITAVFTALSIVGYGVFVFAAGPFAPGNTLDPVTDHPLDCSGPLDTDCYVTPGWSLNGNTGTDGGTTDFIGTTDAQDFMIKVDSLPAATFGQVQNIAFGDNAIASSNYAMAVGDLAVASGPDSFAFGKNVVTSGGGAHAFGALITVSGGTSSGASGVGLLARSGFGEMVFGSYNTDYTPVEAVNRDTADRQFVVGNGFLGGRSDAFTILKSGVTGIGFDNFETTADSDLLQVNGAILQSTATACTLNADADGTIICTPSDRNLKQNIENISYGLDTVMQLRPVSYEFINPSFGIGNQIGFIAQELEQVIPEVVTTGPDYKSVNYPLITSVLTKAIQELNLKIDAITTASQTVVVQSGFGFTDLQEWFADAANGIGDFFAQRIHTNELCVGDTCLNEAQINAILDATQVDSNSDNGDGSPDDGTPDGGTPPDAGDDGLPDPAPQV